MTFRNVLAHSAYSISPTKVEALSYLVADRKPKATEITAVELKAKLTIMNAFKKDLMSVVRISTGDNRNLYIRPAE